jgi:hypothetical protein
MPGASQISRTLDHLAWLRKQLVADVNTGNAYAGGLLTYNAAAALQWQFVLPTSRDDTITNEPDRKKAAKIIDDFVWRARELFAKAKRLPKKTSTGEKGKSLLEDLRSAIASVIRRLPRLFGFGSVVVAPADNLMKSLDPIAMLKEWLAYRGLAIKSTSAALKKMGLTGPRSGLRSALAAASVVADEGVYGPRGKEYRQGSGEMVSAMLGHALKDYVATLGGKSAKRMEGFVQEVIRDIEALQVL